MRSSVAQAQFCGISEFGNSLPPPVLSTSDLRLPVITQGLTGRDEDGAISHDASHLLATIAPPIRCGSNVTTQMSLTLVLNVKRKYIIRQVFPLRCAGEQLVAMLQDISKTVIKIKYRRRILIEPSDIVLAGWSSCTVYGGQLVLGNIGI